MAETALRHFVEEALGRHTDDVDDWFPACFHWRGMCTDTPGMVANLGGPAFDPDALELNEAIRSRAERVFLFAHVAALAVLAAVADDETDPVELLSDLLEEATDAEDDCFRELVTDVLGPLEEALAGEDDALDECGASALALVTTVWPTVSTFLGEDGILGEQTQPVPGDDEQSREAVRTVLSSLAQVAVSLAALRLVARGVESESPV